MADQMSLAELDAVVRAKAAAKLEQPCEHVAVERFKQYEPPGVVFRCCACRTRLFVSDQELRLLQREARECRTQ